MKESDAIEAIAKTLYEQAGYRELYLSNFPNRAWERIKLESKEKWYWRAREIFNLIERMRSEGIYDDIQITKHFSTSKEVMRGSNGNAR
jgi:hypothetical protein